MNRRSVLKAAVGFLGLGWLFRAKAPAEPCSCGDLCLEEVDFNIHIGPADNCWYDRMVAEEFAGLEIVGTGTSLDGEWKLVDANTMRRKQ